MIVVADASPLNYLVQLACDLLLPQLYEQVLVPEAVLLELRSRRAPPAVASWATNPPAWVEVCVVQSTPDPVLEELDAGERSAIQLAQQRGSVVLIDEYRGREVAARRGVQTIGTLGILLAASQRGIADGEAAFLNLVKTTSFRVSAHVRADFAAKFAVLRKKATE